MQHTEAMLRSHPRPEQADQGALARCIDACFDCAQTCTSCADACLGEAGVGELVRCIRLNLDCADVCEAAGRLASRQTDTEPELLRRQLEACAAACRLCGEECARHAGHMEHCRVCAEACRKCEEACNALLAGFVA